MKILFSVSIGLALLAAPVFAQTSKNDVVDFGEPKPLTIVTEEGVHEFMVDEAKTLDQQRRDGLANGPILKTLQHRKLEQRSRDRRKDWCYPTKSFSLGIERQILLVPKSEKLRLRPEQP